MSYALDAANRLHNRQVEAATQMQDLVFKAAGGLAALRDKAPQPPAALTAPFEKVAEPVGKLVGTRREIADYVGQTRRDWSDLRTRFQDGIALKFAHAEPSVTPEAAIVPVVTVVPKGNPRAKAPKAADA